MLHASERIAEDMSVIDAAKEFCWFNLNNLRDDEEKETGTKMSLPAWFARTAGGNDDC